MPTQHIRLLIFTLFREDRAVHLVATYVWVKGYWNVGELKQRRL